MADTTVTVINGTTIVEPFGASLLGPILAEAAQFVAVAALEAGVAQQAAAAAVVSQTSASLSAAAAGAASARYPTTAAGIAAVAEGAYLLVPSSTSAGRLYQKVSGAAVDTGVDIPSALLVAQTGNLSRYLADMRVTLRRPMSGSRGITSTAYRTVASNVINGAARVTTDGAAVPYWTPDAGGFYLAAWCRDMAYASQFAPEFFPTGQLAQVFAWYAAKSNTTARPWQVPDHIYAQATSGQPQVRWTPGSQSVDPSDAWGVRAPVDGNFMLVMLAWTHFERTGTPALFNDWKALLRGLLDNAPTDPTTGCIYVDPNAIYVSDGFIDTVRLLGSVSYATVLFYQAWRHYAEMCFASGDQVEALRAIGHAETVKAGLNNPANGLWASIGNSGSPLGLFYASNGTLSAAQWDIAASALAVYTGAATSEHADAISDKLAIAFSTPINGKPNLFAHGGIRRVLRENDYSPGVQVWQTEIFGSPQTAYDDYQSGGVWPFYTIWVIYALARRHADLAAAMAQQVLTEYGRESRIDGTILWPECYTVSTSTTSAGYGPVEPTTETYNQYRTKQYMVSAAAILAIDNTALGSMAGTTTRMTPTSSQTFTNGTIAKLALQAVVGTDQLGGADTATSEIRASLSTRYRCRALARFGSPAVLPVGAFLQVYINGVPGEVIDTRSYSVATESGIGGSLDLSLNGGDRVSVWLLASGGNLVTQLPGNSQLYMSFSLSTVGV